MEGRQSICWECEQPFEITKKTLRYQKKPKCEICTGSVKEREPDLINELKERLTSEGIEKEQDANS